MKISTLLRLQWDRTLAVLAAVVGAVALFLGYWGVSRTDLVAGQLPYLISGGLFGMFAVTIAATLWLSADFRDEWRELRTLREHLTESAAAPPVETTTRSAR
jgi:hypothetical protein